MTEFDRGAVITIQGGGLYGLTMLGHLQTLVDRIKVTPFALAGTSAGAIVAALYWAGLRPLEIRDKFIELTKDAQDKPNNRRLLALLGPFKPEEQPFTFESFRDLKKHFDAFAPLMERQFGLTKEGGIRRLLASPCRMVKALRRFRSMRAALGPHFARQGVFEGKELERTIDAWMRSSKKLAPYADSLPSNRLLRFCDISRLLKAEIDAGREVHFPLLFLTATNLSERRLELFNSFEERFSEVPIATAVRASAGFPGFFQPVQILGQWYVDGGVISNFPAWVFCHEFRRRLAASLHAGLASRPWVHFGLRVVDDPVVGHEGPLNTQEFIHVMAGLLSGSARNELEHILSSFVGRSILIEQPVAKTGGPSRLLDFDELNEEKITTKVTKGAEFAEQELASMSFSLPSKDSICPILGKLVDKCLAVLGQPDNDTVRLRSNVFLPDKEQLTIEYSVNMDGPEDTDRQMTLESDAGLTGFCFFGRCPYVCNLGKIGELARQWHLRPHELFNMTQDAHARVRQDRSWLASVPIFDPCAFFPPGLAGAPYPAPPGVSGQHYCQLPSGRDGAVMGVLNLDAALPYDTLGLSDDPAMHYTDVRIRSIIDIMAATALELGIVFSEFFGTKRP